MCEETKKQVRVIMPFGGDDEKKERAAAVEFNAIKHMVKKYGQKHDVEINADISQKFTGEINDPVLEEIAEADVVVAVLKSNVNVTYELAFRHLLRGQMILLVLDQSARPKYIDDWAYIKFDKKMILRIGTLVDDTDNYPTPSLLSGKLSPGIEEAIDSESEQTYPNFENAMEQALNQDPTPSHFFEDVVLPLQNKKIAAATGTNFGLGEWGPASYYPLSVVRVDWKGISDEANGKYDAKDLVKYEPSHGPIIFDANKAFLDLYSLRVLQHQTPSQAIESLNEQKPLDSLTLINHLATNGAAPNWDKEAFMEDQRRLANNVIFVDEEASSTYRPNIDRADGYAKIPIIISNKHPVQGFQGKSFLPCLLAKRHSGKFPKGRHSTFLLVAYIDVTDLDKMPKGLKGAPVA